MPVDKMEVRSLIREGLSLSEIGRRLDVSRQRIQQIASEMGFSSQMLRKIREERERKLIERVKELTKDYDINDPCGLDSICFFTDQSRLKILKIAHKEKLR